LRAKTHASGVPTTKHTNAETTEVASESRSALDAGAELSWSSNVLHGVRVTRPTNGKATKIAPTDAAAASALWRQKTERTKNRLPFR
jgi:hypothetical protein